MHLDTDPLLEHACILRVIVSICCLLNGSCLLQVQERSVLLACRVASLSCMQWWVLSDRIFPRRCVQFVCGGEVEHSSSTAQGGGGSFKNRKPIGEVGCCEPLMAERSHGWIERWLMSPLFLSLSVSYSDCLPTYPPIYLCIHLSIYPSIHLSVYPSIHLSIYPSIHVCLSTCLSASLKTKLFCETSSRFELDNIKNAAILLDFLNVWTWQHQKRSNSARLRQCLNLTTSKTKQFCETS